MSRTISGFPLGSEEDMAYHRATGEQIPKSEQARREYAEKYGFDTMAAGFMLDSEHYLKGRTVITVSSAVDFDRLAERVDLPEGVEVVVVDPLLFPPGVDGYVLDDSPKLDEAFYEGIAKMNEGLSAYGSLALSALGASAGLASTFSSVGKSLIEAQTNTQNGESFEMAYFDDLRVPGYVPPFSGYYANPMNDPGSVRIHDAIYHASAVTEKNVKRVAKDRARNKAARKQRQHGRRK